MLPDQVEGGPELFDDDRFRLDPVHFLKPDVGHFSGNHSCRSVMLRENGFQNSRAHSMAPASDQTGILL
ncbi:hypothetical protein [Arthrobacter sp. Soil736]|uniref:hypothetical protein n=1 Tax=Arthrobacter sp. Soil736 TaxID=1736395 RepID=UPI001F11B463|nr:hypothetical protein [Arthrobacter sp. Soil736]